MDATRISELLFGRACRLPIALWILGSQKDRFYQSEPPESLAARTAIRQELERLAEVGLVYKETPDHENRVYYVRTTSPLWEVIRVAAEVIEQLDR
ncbi:hypothetical protein CG716_13655 [Mycolicibacterium sphagni]|uniref:Transcriptional regulator n=1 Tax=Mycolicibacterium sphagni TaxID=1786 RepID=A0A255DHF8_9MYCO|nr:hypothetical protein CG716_13655 [Mycolicibacterium sphagni]